MGDHSRVGRIHPVYEAEKGENAAMFGILSNGIQIGYGGGMLAT